MIYKGNPDLRNTSGRFTLECCPWNTSFSVLWHGSQLWHTHCEDTTTWGIRPAECAGDPGQFAASGRHVPRAWPTLQCMFLKCLENHGGNFSNFRLMLIFSKIKRFESFTTHSKFTTLLMLVAAAKDITINLPSSTFGPQKSLREALHCSDSLISAGLRSWVLLPSLSNPHLLPRQGPISITVLPQRCSTKASKRASILSSQALHQQCAGHQVQLRQVVPFLLPILWLEGFTSLSCLSSHKMKQNWQFTHLSYQVSIFSMDQDNSPKTF